MRTRGGRRGRRLLTIALVVFVPLALLAAFTREGRTAVRTAALVPYLFPNPPTKPLSWVTATPIYEEVAYADELRSFVADVYRPGDAGRHGAIILSLGVHPVARDYPALLQLADGLARAGLVVMIPESPDLRADRILPQERDALVAAFRHLQAQPYVDTRRMGFVGFSVGASVVTLAASDARIRDGVALVNFFGGYYDAFELLRAVATHRMRYAGAERPWSPSELTESIFAKQLLDTLEESADRALVKRFVDDKRELSASELDGLRPRGRLVYELFSANEPERVDAILADLPEDMRERLRAISPSAYADGLRARMYVMHDTDDSYIPYVESRRLVDRLPARQRVYTEFSIFAHVEPTRSLNALVFAGEVAKLYRHIFLVLRDLS